MPGMKSVVGMGGMGDARELAEMLRQLGRGNDTVLAHITPEEAQMLMDMGGSGGTNPNTGLPEFQQDFDFGESYGNVTGEPVDYSYMSTPEYDFGYGTQAQISGAPVDMTGFRQPTGFERALAPQEAPAAGLSPELQRSVAEMPPGLRFDITPQVSPFQREVPGIMPRELLPEAAPQPGMLTRGAQAVEDTAAKARELAGKYPTVARLLSTGVSSLPALLGAARARRESEAAAAQFRRLGEPLRTQGEALRQQAMAGGLTPQQASAQEAQRARLRQTASTRGATTGTQAAMIENQLARARSELSQTNLNNAIRLLNLANAYDEEAIRAKLAGDVRINNYLGRIAANLGQVAGVTMGAPAEQQLPQDQGKRITQRPELKQG